MIQAPEPAGEIRERAALIHREIYQIGALIALAILAFVLTRAIAMSNRDMTLRDAAEWFRRGQQAMQAGMLTRRSTRSAAPQSAIGTTNAMCSALAAGARPQPGPGRRARRADDTARIRA